MASLLTAIGAGLVVGQGRRIEADQEATRKADDIRAQKLQEFDFQTQLQDSRIKAEMKMKDKELAAKYKDTGGNALEIFEQMRKNRATYGTPPEASPSDQPTSEAGVTSKWSPKSTATDDAAVIDSYDMQIAANLAKNDLPKATDVENEKLRWQQTNKKDLMKGDSTYRDAWMASIKDTPLYHPSLTAATHSTVGNTVKSDLITTGDIIYNNFLASGIDKDTARNVTDDFVKLYGQVVIPSSSASFNRGETVPTSKSFKPAYPAEREAAAQELLQAMESNSNLAKVVRERNAPLYNYIKSIKATKEMVNQVDNAPVTKPVMPNKTYKSAAEVMADTSLGTPQDRVKKVRELGL